MERLKAGGGPSACCDKDLLAVYVYVNHRWGFNQNGDFTITDWDLTKQKKWDVQLDSTKSSGERSSKEGDLTMMT